MTYTDKAQTFINPDDGSLAVANALP
jgi:hypothetical protein